jgi:hypothetical protein
MMPVWKSIGIGLGFVVLAIAAAGGILTLARLAHWILNG